MGTMLVENNIYAEWLVRQGHHVVRTKSSFWYDAGPHVYQAFPFGWLIEPSENELHQLMVHHGILSLRYSSPIGSNIGKISYHVTLKNQYNIDILRSQARNAVKRGLARCEITRIPFDRLACEGWDLQRDTLERQGRYSIMSQSQWSRLCTSAVDLDGFEAWAAIVEGGLAASVIVCRLDDTFYVPFACSHRKYLDMYVNNALFYSVSCDLLSRDGINSIFFTVQSLDAPKTVDDFKFRMGFIAVPVRQRVVFNPVVQPLITDSTHRIVLYLVKRFPTNATLAKLEGMIRFYRQGRLAPDKQDWPECLIPVKLSTSL